MSPHASRRAPPDSSRRHAYITKQVNNRQEMDTKTSGDTRSGYEWIALSVTTIGALMAAINASAVIIALPTIMADLQADFITIKWMLLSYMLILAALVPVIGRLADMLGRKNVYNLGFIIFIVGSLLCGLCLSRSVVGSG
ncbi:MAG: MFS transporter [Halobacteriota archaeon]